jgi:hypothetical protein
MEEKKVDKSKGDQPPEEKKAEKRPDTGEKGEKKGPAVALPPADFPNFILSLSASALFHLGDIKNPETDEVEKDPVMAKHTIDIISMLKEKTKGNLTDDEARLIENALHDLRMRYVKAIGEKDKTNE